ncbi:tetratricopeptide repeat-containing sulfotransferase family protein [Sandaracinobacteroides hominis]|uniref:tetratricopeptide repeat-containing sulfotransferase family protein n=1 Tax=Sandaracinobacteroides hominis TaxID=2780086 RepID=UPI0018F603B8|nr:sulfotransferase [Sandaracinobacteroides hominis]
MASRIQTLLPPHANDAEGWQRRAVELREAGKEAAADEAQARALRASTQDAELIRAASALVAGDLPTAEGLLRQRLRERPTDVPAIRMLAELAGRIGRYADAEKLLRRALELAPGFHAARHNLAVVLQRQGKAEEALIEIDRLTAIEPGSPGYRVLRAAILVRLGNYNAAIDVYDKLLASHPDQPMAWMSYGHSLKTVGRQADSIAAYRRAIQQAPTLGEVWWSLANLKTVQFSDADIAAMEQALTAEELSETDRFHLEFALGKAQEDRRNWEASFAHYARGNAQRRAQLDYSADETSAHVEEAKRLYSPEFFAARAGWGCPAPDPIFVVGLPRSGSTLIEQILSSHSLVEGTMELPDVITLARRIGKKRGDDNTPGFAENLARLDREAVRALGEEYLERTRIQRKTEKPFFIDKMPNNFQHTGLIHLILPKAKIIDARRHPLGCCFSGFKQHFARGQAFTYDLSDIGRYWADYARLMAHFDEVLPGRVYRQYYERMVASPEAEIRALLAYAGLDFEPACLSFHETERAVRTASSEQVRTPLYASAVDHWQQYDKWLTPLRSALGSALDSYPGL